jgi:membrane-bound metal-dependent hydrolase YbcI (DUF457 family)
MPSPLAHSFCGFVLFRDTEKHLFRNQTYAASFIVFFSNVPDYDYLIGIFKGDLMWGHRLITHTILFPLITGALIGMGALLLRKRFLPLFSLSAVLMGIHILLDYLSYDFNPDNGIGIPLFRPLSTDFFAFPFHPVASRIIGDPPKLMGILANDLFFMCIFGALMLWRAKYEQQKQKRARRTECALEL